MRTMHMSGCTAGTPESAGRGRFMDPDRTRVVALTGMPEPLALGLVREPGPVLTERAAMFLKSCSACMQAHG